MKHWRERRRRAKRWRGENRRGQKSYGRDYSFYAVPSSFTRVSHGQWTRQFVHKYSPFSRSSIRFISCSVVCSRTEPKNKWMEMRYAFEAKYLMINLNFGLLAVRATSSPFLRHFRLSLDIFFFFFKCAAHTQIRRSQFWMIKRNFFVAIFPANDRKSGAHLRRCVHLLLLLVFAVRCQNRKFGTEKKKNAKSRLCSIDFSCFHSFLWLTTLALCTVVSLLARHEQKTRMNSLQWRMRQDSPSRHYA